MQNSIDLTVSQVRGVVLASAKNDARYYLNGALFDFKDGRVVATDGHCLLALNVTATVRESGYPSVIVAREHLESIAKGGRVTDIITIFYGESGLNLHREGGVDLDCTPIDGKFPEYARVMPDKTSGDAGQFDPDLMARIAKALRLACNAPKSLVPAVGHNGKSGAIVSTKSWGWTSRLRRPY